MLRALLISAVCSFATWNVAAAQMPSEAEIRAQLEAAGMSPAQIDQALVGFEAAATPSAPGVTESPAPVCGDDTGLCDDDEDGEVDENDPDVISCRVNYLDAITKFTMDNYGTRMGEDPVGIAFTCQAASAGEIRSLTSSGVSSAQIQLEAISEFWDAVKLHGVDLRPELRSRYERIYNAPSLNYGKMPSDLRGLAQLSASLDSQDAHVDQADKASHQQRMLQYINTAKPIHQRCEAIRRNVGASFRSQYVDNAVCLKSVPVADDALEDEE